MSLIRIFPIGVICVFALMNTGFLSADEGEDLALAGRAFNDELFDSAKGYAEQFIKKYPTSAWAKHVRSVLDRGATKPSRDGERREK